MYSSPAYCNILYEVMRQAMFEDGTGEYFNYSGDTVVAVIRLMKQPRQILQIRGNSTVQFSFHSRFDKSKEEKETFTVENLITHRNIAPLILSYLMLFGLFPIS